MSGLACTIADLFPPTSVLGANLLTGFLGGAVFTDVRVHGDAADMVGNVVIGVMAWAGLWLRDCWVRKVLPIKREWGATFAVDITSP